MVDGTLVPTVVRQYPDSARVFGRDRLSLAPRKRLWLWVPLVRCTVRVIAKVTDQRVIWRTLRAFRLRSPGIERINGTNR